VRFHGDQELETFSAMVQTAAPLTHRVARLTRLSQADLADAVPPRQALEGLAQFIGSSPLVGQSVELDAEHLRRAGLALRVTLLDTFELASLLLPGLPAYDLETVAQALGLDVGQERHRALADARLAMRAFNRLIGRIRRLDLDSLAQINRLSLPLGWPLRPLFEEAERERTQELMRGGVQADSDAPGWLLSTASPRARETLTPNEFRTPLAVDDLEQSLRVGSQLAMRLEGFEERSEQIQMLRAVAQAFNDSEHLLVEAGTGTGKSLAYLLPAARFALANHCRVVVSTSTINLQDQLSQKDLPWLAQATGLPLTFTVLKGRANYLCLRRWLALLRSDDLAPAERSLLIKTLLWLPLTTTGDRAELRLSGREQDAWSRVCALADACSPQHCAYNRAGRCFLARARRAAEASHLVVVNHSLLVADLATDSRVLPSYRHLIVDEAHHLEDEASAQLGWQLGLPELTANLERLWADAAGAVAGPRRAGGLVPQIDLLLRVTSSEPEIPSCQALVHQLNAVIAELAEGFPRLFAMLGRFLVDHGQRSESGVTTLRLTAATRAQPAWSDVEIAADDLSQPLRRLVNALQELSRVTEAVADPSEELGDLSGQLAIQLAFWELVSARLSGVLSHLDRATVAWLSVGRGGDVYLNAVPLHVGDHLSAGLFAEKDCVILTSATLTAEQSFDYVRERLGLEDARELSVGSPFDYSRAALVYLPTDSPEPNSPGYQRCVEQATGETIAALGGRTLVLFTSYSQLRAAYEALKERLEERQVVLLGQRMDGASRARLLETFKSGDRVALMGTASFWEGVDVVGEALSCLIIPRLPFTVPSDPVFQARCEAFEDPFNQYAVPQAVLRFRQGFGRLIRSRSDRGVVLVLDRRIKSRWYGRAFLNSLPRCQIREGRASEAAAVAEDWLGHEVLSSTCTPHTSLPS
jgi:predicted DnaQ family exonuclease/DinG family helicase